MDNQNSKKKSPFGRDDRSGRSFFRARRDGAPQNDNHSDNRESHSSGSERPHSSHAGERKPYGERDSSKPRYGNNDRDSKPRYGNNDRDSKPRYGDRDNRGNSGDREFKPRYGGDRDNRGGGDREFKPRYGNNDRDSKPRYSDRDNRGGGDREFKPRFGNNDRDNRGGGGDREFKPRFGSKPAGDREFKPRYGNNDRDNRGGGDREFKPRYGNNDRDNRGGSDRSDRSFRPRYDKPRDERSDKRDRKARYEEAAKAMPEEMRLNRFIAMSGVCSRREADQLIETGEVTVNGVMVDVLGTKINTGTDEIRLNGELLKGEKKVYIVINKPKGYVTTVEDPHADQTVMDLLKGECPERIYPVGRLDKNTTGVLLLTNDGNLTKELTHPSFAKKKIYHVFLDKPCNGEDLEKLTVGLELEDGMIQADEVSFVDDKGYEVGVELHSGRNRIVRRMFESLGYDVVKLDRVYFAGLTKMGLRRGFWRHLTAREVSALKSGSYE